MSDSAASSDSMDDRLDRALEDVEAGRGETFDNSEEFLASLDVGTMEEQLVEALRAIVAVPSERTLLLNAEARAMYEIAKRTLEEVERRGS